MFRSISRWFRSTNSRPQTRKARLLSLDVLEAREVPAAFTLTNGNLYNTAISQTQPIDTDVESYTVVNNQVFDLHLNGNVELMNLDGTGQEEIAATASSLVSDATGNVFLMNYTNGTIWEHIQGTGWDWTEVAGQASSLVSDATGNVFLMNPNGTIWEHIQGTGWGWTQVAGQASSLVSDATGNVFLMNPNGTIWEHIQGTGWGWTQVAGQASSLLSDATGNVFLLNPNGTIWEHIQGTGWGWTQVGGQASSVQSFAIGSNGNFYLLHTNNDLTLNSTNGTQLKDYGVVTVFSSNTSGTSGVAFTNGHLVFDTPLDDFDLGVVAGVRSDGVLYTLAQNNDLTLRSISGQLVADFGVVQGFAMSTDGSGYVLLPNENLYRNTPTANIFIDSGVQSFGFRSDGNLYALHTNNDLTIDSTTGQRYGDFGVVQSFAIDSDGSGYVLLPTGMLYRNTPTANIFIDSSVKSFGFRKDGNLYALHTNNDLTIDSITGQRYGDFGVVQNFAIGPDGYGYVLLPNGMLYCNTPTANVFVDSGVQNFGFRSDGYIYVLHTNYDLTLNNTSGQQLVDFGVVQGFAMGANGVGYFLQNGNLVHNTPTVNVVLSGGVKSFIIGSDGKALYLVQDKISSGTIYHEGSSTPVEVFVDTFTPDNHGGIYILQFGNLYEETVGATVAQTEASRIRGNVGNNHSLDGNVVEIAPDGHGGLYMLFSGRDLWDITYAGGARSSQSLIANSVQDFYFDTSGNLKWDNTTSGFLHILEDVGAVVVAAVATYFTAGALSEVGVGLAAGVIGEGAAATIVGTAIGAAAASVLVQEAEHFAFGTQFNWSNVLESGLTAGAGSVVNTGLLQNAVSFLNDATSLGSEIASSPLAQYGLQFLGEATSGIVGGKSITTSLAQGVGSLLDSVMVNNLGSLPFGVDFGSLLSNVVSGNVNAMNLLQTALPILQQTVTANLGGTPFGTQLGSLLQQAASGTLNKSNFLQAAEGLLQQAAGINLSGTLSQDVGSLLQQEVLSTLGSTTLATDVGAILSQAVELGQGAESFTQGATSILNDVISGSLAANATDAQDVVSAVQKTLSDGLVSSVGQNVLTFLSNVETGIQAGLATAQQALTALDGALEATAASATSVEKVLASFSSVAPAAPTAPSLTATAISASQVNLSWTAVTGATSYFVNEWTGSAWKQIGSLTSGTTSFLVTGLTAGTTYSFDVGAFNTAGGNWANYQSATTLQAALVAPAAPAFTATAISPTQVNLSWNVVAGATSYQINEWSWSTNTWQEIATVSGSSIIFSVTGLSSSTNYDFFVGAVNSAGTTWSANYESATTPA